METKSKTWAPSAIEEFKRIIHNSKTSEGFNYPFCAVALEYVRDVAKNQVYRFTLVSHKTTNFCPLYAYDVYAYDEEQGNDLFVLADRDCLAFIQNNLKNQGFQFRDPFLFDRDKARVNLFENRPDEFRIANAIQLKSVEEFRTEIEKVMAIFE
ncbi:MAG: hypothetical protein LBO09_07845 [Candidatus Peribacteria bacterium]|jgi:hypothetical protein|nr:hypothetical protein [Candidatus Peribacteria bacterium]